MNKEHVCMLWRLSLSTQQVARARDSGDTSLFKYSFNFQIHSFKVHLLPISLSRRILGTLENFIRDIHWNRSMTMSSQASDQLKKRTFYQDEWPLKTVDIGANGVTVSANPLGQIYQISSPLDARNRYGIMVATPWRQFDHNQRTNPSYVREFRKIPEKFLMQQSNGLGLDFGGQKGPVVIRHIRNSMGSLAQFEYRIHDSNLFVQTVLKVHNDGRITHASKVTNMNDWEQDIPVTLDLEFAVSRAGYGQLTDRGAVDMPDPSNMIEFFRGKNGAGVLGVQNPSLGGWMLAHTIFSNETTQEHIEVDDVLFPDNGVQQYPPLRSMERPIQEISLGPWETLKLVVSFRPGTSLPCQFGYFSGMNGADQVAPDGLFSHQDGMSDFEEIAQRHHDELSGFNWDSTETIESTILWANVNYILGCCCVPQSGPQRDGTCCIADHFALNLGWPRDNYWQMRLLMKLDSEKLENLLPNNPRSVSYYQGKLRQVLTNHLTWLFEMAVTHIRIDGAMRHFWRRSYLVNGMPKDGEVFQLDTQCYPFLELCEYFEAYWNEPETGCIIESILMTDSFTYILQDLLSRRDIETNLFASDETPADDDLGEYKFHLSSNILLWHTLFKLGELLSIPQFRPLVPAAVSGEVLLHFASVIKDSILGNFISRHTFTTRSGQVAYQDILAYGINPYRDPRDPLRYRHYHDGNDLPTLYAQEWGFLKTNGEDEPDNPHLRRIWENTMIWAFTPGPASAGFNTGYQGTGNEPFHGLGSDHSPGPWTLGFFQEWKFAQMIGDRRRERKAWRQIQGSAQFDGTFSEAVDIQTGVCTSKTWFSWPGAMIAENLIDTVIDQAMKDALWRDG